jgi:hypothetical protein
MASVGFYSAFILGAVFLVLGLLLLEPFALLLQANPENLKDVKSYLVYILLGSPFIMSSFVLNNQFRYQGSANYAMVAIVIGAIINIGLDPLVMFACNLGIKGAAYATIFSQIASFILLIVVSNKGENIHISGKLNCPGLLNAENIDMKMFGSTSEVGSIGGSSIRVTVERNHPEVTRLISKLLGRHGHVGLTVKESIEGDDISLEKVTAKIVTGRTVAIGEGCHIDLVQYSETIEISPDAYVGRQERI